VLPGPPLSNLARRNALDEQDELDAAEGLSPAESFVQTLELSELVLELARATGSATESDLAEKAARYARPLRLIADAARR
jgi:hypothetical protein